ADNLEFHSIETLVVQNAVGGAIPLQGNALAAWDSENGRAPCGLYQFSAQRNRRIGRQQRTGHNRQQCCKLASGHFFIVAKLSILSRKGGPVSCRRIPWCAIRRWRFARTPESRPR